MEARCPVSCSGAFHKGIFVSGCNKATTTYTHGPKFIGLHIDSMHTPAASRDASPIRACINLGAGSRYLHFINLRHDQITQLLPEDHAFQRSATSQGQEFMRYHQDYPVISLRIEPGELYLAPTENIIHDGSTFTNPFLDAQFTLHGILPGPVVHSAMSVSE